MISKKAADQQLSHLHILHRACIGYTWLCVHAKHTNGVCCQKRRKEVFTYEGCQLFHFAE